MQEQLLGPTQVPPWRQGEVHTAAENHEHTHSVILVLVKVFGTVHFKYREEF